MNRRIILPERSDYPDYIFRLDIPSEYQVGCAKAYYNKNFIVKRLFIDRLEKTFDLLPSQKIVNALDIGTGSGIFLPTLSQISENVYGVDLSKVIFFVNHMLEKQDINNVFLTMGDVTSLPYESSTFDLIVCLSLIEHVEDLHNAFSEMRRVMNDNSVLILGYPVENRFHRFFKWLSKKESSLRVSLSKQKVLKEKRFHPHVSDYKQIEKEASNFFNILDSEDVNFLCLRLYSILKLSKK